MNEKWRKEREELECAISESDTAERFCALRAWRTFVEREEVRLTRAQREFAYQMIQHANLGDIARIGYGKSFLFDLFEDFLTLNSKKDWMDGLKNET